MSRRRQKEEEEEFKLPPAYLAAHGGACSIGTKVKFRHQTKNMKRSVRETYDARCAACKKDWEPVFQVDHIVPRAIGGPDIEENLQMLCPNCHARKNAMEPGLIRTIREIQKEGIKTYIVCFKCGDTYSSYFWHYCDDRPRAYAPEEMGGKPMPIKY